MWFKKKRVYADAAGGMPPHYNPGALHQEGLAAKKKLEAARAQVAAALNAHADEIYFVSNATEANRLVIEGQPVGAGTITSAIEHRSVLEPLRERGNVTEVAVDKEGMVFPSAVALALQPDTAFVSIQLVNSEMGAVQPVREIAKELQRKRTKSPPAGGQVYFHTDAAQAPLWIKLDMQKLPVDLMTLDGILYIKRGTPFTLPRQGTPDVAAAVAAARFLVDAQAGVEKRVKKVTAVRDYLWNEIKKVLPDTILNGPSISKGSPCYRVANNLNISIPKLDAQMAVVSLDALGIAASTRSACNIGDEEPSHVIKAMGVRPELTGTAIRLTLLPNASYRDARRIVEALQETAERYRR